MIRLTRVELRRLLWRRLTLVAVLGALAITGLMLFGAYDGAKPLSGPELTLQRAQFDQAQKDWAANGAQQVQDCLTQQAQTQKTDPKADLGCQQMEPKWETWGKQPVKFAETMPNILLGGALLLAFVGFVVGAGFVAPEFSRGSIGSWLTFEPRRMRVYASKLAAAGLGMVPVAVALLGLLTAGTWLVLGHFDSTSGTTAKVWGDIGAMGARSVVLTLAATVTGAAIAVLLRRTAAVLGVAIGYLVLVEGIFRQRLEGEQAWLLQVNFLGWLQHGATYHTQTCTTDARGSYSCQSVQAALTFGHSAAYLAVLVLIAVALAALVFRRRDVS